MKTKFRWFFDEEWFLFLCPAFVVVHGFAHFSESIYWLDAALLFLQTSLSAFALALIFSFFLKFRQAALFATALVLLNFVFAGFFEKLMMGANPPFFARFRLLIPALLILFGAFFYWLKKSKRAFAQTRNYLNLLFLLLIFFDAFRLVAEKLARRKELVQTTICKKCSTPDVYLLVADGYAGERQLKERFGFDNKAFLDSLRSLGFFLPVDPHSNYSATNNSMSSLLNMQYTGKLSDDVHAAFNPNGVVQFFKQQGYRIVNNSFFKIDDQFPLQPIGYFETNAALITQHTLMAQLHVLLQNYLYEKHFSFVLNKLKKHEQDLLTDNLIRDSLTMDRLLSETKTEAEKPTFIYSHFLAPHPPFLFDSSGKRFTKDVLPQSRYLSYLKWTNGRLLSAVNAVIKNSRTPPVILLISDHGYRNDDLPALDPLRFYNLVSVLLPNKNYTPFYKGVSNVNLFRILLNDAFGQQLPLLRDSTVY